MPVTAKNSCCSISLLNLVWMSIHVLISAHCNLACDAVFIYHTWQPAISSIIAHVNWCAWFSDWRPMFSFHTLPLRLFHLYIQCWSWPNHTYACAQISTTQESILLCFATLCGNYARNGLISNVWLILYLFTRWFHTNEFHPSSYSALVCGGVLSPSYATVRVAARTLVQLRHRKVPAGWVKSRRLSIWTHSFCLSAFCGNKTL